MRKINAFLHVFSGKHFYIEMDKEEQRIIYKKLSETTEEGVRRMEPYKHVVQYYETDKMGITHHSNYIKWMEEARIDFLKQIGWGFEKLEEAGIVSPVLEVACKYKNSTTFADEVFINVSIKEFKGVKLILSYEMKKNEKVVAIGESSHCFLDKNGCPIRLAKEFPKFYETLMGPVQLS